MFLENAREPAVGTGFSNGSVDGPVREQGRGAFVITMAGMGMPPARATHPTATRPTCGPKDGRNTLFTLDGGSDYSRKLEATGQRHHTWYTY